MSNLERVHLLLSIEEKLRVHTGFANLKKEVWDELRILDATPVLEDEPTPVTVFPADSGVVETDTDHVTPEFERRV